MLQNYLKTALRNLLRNKVYSLINILGLAIGLACCLLIMIFVIDELSFDRFHEKAAAIYRINWDFKWNNDEGIGPGTPPPLAATLMNEFPEIDTAVRLYPVPDMIVRHENKYFTETKILAVDPNFFDVFSFSLLKGNPRTALSEPNCVILTEETARKYFGNKPALGKILTIGEDKQIFGKTYQATFKVTGLVQNPPHNSHIQFDMLTSMASHPQVAYFDWSWIWMQVVTYVLVPEGVSIHDLETKLAVTVQKYLPRTFERVGLSYTDLLHKDGRWTFVFQPLSDLYLGSTEIGNRLGPLGNRDYVYVFIVIAVLILVIACINFTNLATARASGRAREVGVRKTLGSLRSSLIGQFLTEALLYSAIAMLIASGMVELLIGPFNYLSGKNLAFKFFEPSWFPLLLLALTVFLGLAAGYYPGIYLSSFNPVEILKGGTLQGMKSRGLRNALVIFQFVISIGLITCTLLTQRQLAFLKHKDLGFEKENIIVISNENNRLGTKARTYKEIIKNNSRVVNATISTGVPPQWGFQDYYQLEGQGSETTDLISYMTDEDFLSTLGISIIAGRGFSGEFETDAEGIILNETAVKQFGWKEPLGKKVIYPESGEFRVIGVMEDFNYASLHNPILPFALFHRSSNSYSIPASYIAVRVIPGDFETTLHMLEDEWHKLAPDVPFDYSFLDENIDSQYQGELRLGKIFLIFAALAIFIACLGLFGLAAYTAEQRTREIGIRKVLGATIPGLAGLLSKDFLRLILVANVFAWPLAYFTMDKWLQDFAYRTAIDPAVFIASGILALLIALLTVSFQIIRAALSNPVESLRYE